jgi:hypothetical protein
MEENRAQLARRDLARAVWRMRQHSVRRCPALINYRQRWIIFKRAELMCLRRHTRRCISRPPQRAQYKKRGAIAYLRSPIIKTRAPAASRAARVRALAGWLGRRFIYSVLPESPHPQRYTSAPIEAAPSLENN